MREFRKRYKFLFVGPRRTATTWTYEMLKKHNNICLPSNIKETGFFLSNHGKGLEWYQDKFNKREKCDVYGEVGSEYFDIPLVPNRVYDCLGPTEIFINIRNPVDRAFSSYLQHLSKGRVTGSFEDAIIDRPRIVTAGKYKNHISRWLSVFSNDNVHLLFVEDIDKNPKYVLKRVLRHIGLPYENTFDNKSKKINKAKSPTSKIAVKISTCLTSVIHSFEYHWIIKKFKENGLKSLMYTDTQVGEKSISEKTRKALEKEYEEDMCYLEKITDRDLSEWRSGNVDGPS